MKTLKELNMAGKFAILDALMDSYFELQYDGRLKFTGTKSDLKRVMKHFNKMKELLFSGNEQQRKEVAQFIGGLYIHTRGKCATFIKISELIRIESQEIIDKCRKTGIYSDQAVKELQKIADNAEKWHEIELTAEEFAMNQLEAM